MKGIYIKFIDELTTQLLQIEKDIAMIEKGQKEKDCFKPIVDVGKLKIVRHNLLNHINDMFTIVQEIDNNERG